MFMIDTSAASTLTSPQKTKGEFYESLAFNFCKAATIILLTGPFALPIASGLAMVFFLLAHFHGKHDSRCILKRPLLIAGFWGTICLLWLVFHFAPPSFLQELIHKSP